MNTPQINIPIVLATISLMLPFHVFSQARGNSPSKVIVAPISYQSQVSNIEAVGSAEAVKSVSLFPAVSERVTAVKFAPGQQVNKGDVLLTLYNQREQVALQRSEIQLADAKREYQRLVDSQKKGAAAQSQVDLASTQLALAEVAVKEAQVALNDRIVVAPFAGIVGLTDVEVGDRIGPQTLITTLDDRQSLFVNFTVPEVAVAMIAERPMVSLTPWQNRELSIPAEIAQVDSRINPQDRTIRVRALLDNSDDTYRPGMSFRVALSVSGQEYVAVPEAALLWSATGAYVWQMVDKQATRVDVQIKQRLRGTILLSGDFAPNAPIVVEGVQRLREGQAIRPTNSNGAQP